MRLSAKVDRDPKFNRRSRIKESRFFGKLRAASEEPAPGEGPDPHRVHVNAMRAVLPHSSPPRLSSSLRPPALADLPPSSACALRLRLIGSITSSGADYS